MSRRLARRPASEQPCKRIDACLHSTACTRCDHTHMHTLLLTTRHCLLTPHIRPRLLPLSTPLRHAAMWGETGTPRDVCTSMKLEHSPLHLSLPGCGEVTNRLVMQSWPQLRS